MQSLEIDKLDIDQWTLLAFEIWKSIEKESKFEKKKEFTEALLNLKKAFS